MMFRGLPASCNSNKHNTTTEKKTTSLFVQYLFAKHCDCSSDSTCQHIASFTEAFNSASTAEVSALNTDLKTELLAAITTQNSKEKETNTAHTNIYNGDEERSNNLFIKKRNILQNKKFKNTTRPDWFF